MKFGARPVEAASGAILAHSVRVTDGTIKKGTRLGANEIERLRAAGVATVMVAEPDESDVGEDEVAARIAAALVGPGMWAANAFTGRANLIAEADGVFTLNPVAVDAFNAIDEAMTVATLAPNSRVAKGQMVATVKVIPFAVSEDVVRAAESAAAGQVTGLAVHPFRSRRVHLLLTRFAGDKESVLEKRRAAVAERVTALGGEVEAAGTCAHEASELAACLSSLTLAADDVVLVFGTSATLDRRDVVPAALSQAGGTVEHLGMPVDPGNLLVLGRLGPVLAVGVPSCASSPKINGFDWVLERIFADLPLDGPALAGMGVGGLLGEIATRPQLRRRETPLPEVSPAAATVAAVVLAAGRSTRMGGRFKLTEPLAGKPMVRHAVEAALTSRARPVVVVTGHGSDDVRAALDGLDVVFVHNPNFHDGLSTSLKAGIDTLGAECDAALIMLGDMPSVTAGILDALIDAYQGETGAAICVPTADGRRGNPVLWDARYFPGLRAVQGDTGARHLIGEHAEHVREVDVYDPGIFFDVDTEGQLEQARSR